MKKLLLSRWFLILLVAALALGSWQWEFLLPLSQHKPLRYAIVFSVLFLMALPLESSVIRRTFTRPLAPGLGIFINIGLLPLFAWGISLLLPEAMAKGLLVAAATPCTLASASVWTRRAGGNDSIATMVTVVSSLLCFIVTPMWLWLMTGQNVESKVLRPANMIFQLGLLVVLPIMLAQLLRLYGPLAVWTTRQRVGLATAAQFGILMMVLIGAIRTGEDLSKAPLTEAVNKVESTSPAPSAEDAPRIAARSFALDFALMVLAVMGTHISMFFVGLGVGKLIGLPREEYIAVAFSGSQKTLMVGLQVSIEIGASVLPMVVYHVGQLFVDTLFADWLRIRLHQPGGKAQ